MRLKVLALLLASIFIFNVSYAQHAPYTFVKQLSQQEQEMLANVVQKLQGKENITASQIKELLAEESSEELVMFIGVFLLSAGIIGCAVKCLSQDANPVRDFANLLCCQMFAERTSPTAHEASLSENP